MISSINHQQKIANKLQNKANNKINNLLFTANSNNKNSNLNSIVDNIVDDAIINQQQQNATILNKAQLQQVLIHLLTVNTFI